MDALTGLLPTAFTVIAGLLAGIALERYRRHQSNLVESNEREREALDRLAEHIAAVDGGLFRRELGDSELADAVIELRKHLALRGHLLTPELESIADKYRRAIGIVHGFENQAKAMDTSAQQFLNDTFFGIMASASDAFLEALRVLRGGRGEIDIEFVRENVEKFYDYVETLTEGLNEHEDQDPPD